MTDSSLAEVGQPLRLVLVDRDEIFRLGLRTILGQQVEFEVAAAASSLGQLPSSDRWGANLVILGLGSDNLEACAELRSRQLGLPILLLSDEAVGAELRALVNGHCLRSTPVERLVNAVRRVARGQTWWDPLRPLPQRSLAATPQSDWLAETVGALRRGLIAGSSLETLTAELARLEAQLRTGALSVAQRLFLQGRRRELRAARWLARALLGEFESEAEPDEPAFLSPPAPLVVQLATPLSAAVERGSLVSRSVFERVSLRFQDSRLENRTEAPLELDILRDDKKRELLNTVLWTLEEAVAQFPIDLNPADLEQKRSALLVAVWRQATCNFFGPAYRLPRQEVNYEVTDTLLLAAERVEQEILDKLPLVSDLLAHLLLRTGFQIDNWAYAYDQPAARERAEALLQNLVLHLACAVIAPLLNRFAHEPEIKRDFYGQRLVSTRDIERFRNRLTWRYRLETHLVDPRKIFESRLSLLVAEPAGIEHLEIFAPRDREFRQLSGVRAAVALLLETYDAVVPGLQAAVSFLGNGLIYGLTLIGRGLGLLMRGILQGIGDTLRRPSSDSRK